MAAPVLAMSLARSCGAGAHVRHLSFVLVVCRVELAARDGKVAGGGDDEDRHRGLGGGVRLYGHQAQLLCVGACVPTGRWIHDTEKI